MAQNITLLGASYSDVPSVTLPKTGGGTASFTDVTDTTAAAADVASGKYFYTAAGVLTQGTASGGGGGGASNVVTGTFTGTTTGAAMDVTLNYSGSGHPVAVLIYPSEGAYNKSGTFYSLLQRYATCFFVGIKSDMSTTQDYNVSSTHGNYNQATVYNRYKNSATDYTKYTGNSSGYTEKLFVNTDATASAVTVVQIKSNTNMSVFIASSSYGFAANIEYKYWVLYSS